VNALKRRSIVGLTGVATLLASVAGAQSVTFNSLSPGSRVRVTAPGRLHAQRTMRVVSVGAESIALETYIAGSDLPISHVLRRSEITAIDLYRVDGNKALPGLIFGAIAGALVGSLIGLPQQECDGRPSCRELGPQLAMFGAGGGAMVGGAIGSFTPTGTWVPVWDAYAGNRLLLGPAIVPGRSGFTVGMSIATAR
jgi:hypothetical protein